MVIYCWKLLKAQKSIMREILIYFASGVHWSIERLKALALQQPVHQGILLNSTYIIDSQVWLGFKNLPGDECPIFMGAGVEDIEQITIIFSPK